MLLLLIAALNRKKLHKRKRFRNAVFPVLWVQKILERESRFENNFEKLKLVWHGQLPRSNKTRKLP
jgi:hypothetical protein